MEKLGQAIIKKSSNYSTYGQTTTCYLYVITNFIALETLHCIEIVMLSVQTYIFRENRILVLDIEHRDRYKTDCTLSSILNVKM